MNAPSGMPLPVPSHVCVCGHGDLHHRPSGKCKRTDCDCARFAPVDLPIPATLAADAYMIALAQPNETWSYETDPEGWVSDVQINATDVCSSLERIDAEIAALNAARAAFVAASKEEGQP